MHSLKYLTLAALAALTQPHPTMRVQHTPTDEYSIHSIYDSDCSDCSDTNPTQECVDFFFISSLCPHQYSINPHLILAALIAAAIASRRRELSVLFLGAHRTRVHNAQRVEVARVGGVGVGGEQRAQVAVRRWWCRGYGWKGW